MGDDRHDDELARAIAEAGSEISFGLNAIADALKALAPPPKPVADKLTLSYTLKGGNIMGASVTGNVGNTASPTVVETAAGTPVAPVGPLAFASDNAAVVSVDPSTGVATLVSAGTANVSVIDQGNSLTDTVNFSVSGGITPPADKLNLTYTLNAARRR